VNSCEGQAILGFERGQRCVGRQAGPKRDVRGLWRGQAYPEGGGACVLLLVAEAGAPESSSSAYSPMYKRPCYSWPCSPCGASDALHTRELEVHQTSSMSERTGWTESSTMRSAAPTGRLRPHSRRRRGKLALLVMMGVLGRAEARVRADVFTEGLPPIYDADAPNHVRPLAHQL
jgi:hypothetical protein